MHIQVSPFFVKLLIYFSVPMTTTFWDMGTGSHQFLADKIIHRCPPHRIDPAKFFYIPAPLFKLRFDEQKTSPSHDESMNE